MENSMNSQTKRTSSFKFLTETILFKGCKNDETETCCILDDGMLKESVTCIHPLHPLLLHPLLWP